MYRSICCKNIVKSLVLLTTIINLLGCDAGIQYRPKDWTLVRGDLYWTKTFDQAEFTILPIGGLVGQKYTWLEMFVTNHSGESPIAIISAVLRTRTEYYPATLCNSRPFLPGETRKSIIAWEFKEELTKVLTEPLDVIIVVQVGEEQRTVEIPMIRF
jgi:hypothetical protein